MFQTFSGNSRRPRQVNLSGQNTNPFAPQGSRTPAASGAQKTVAQAQQERLLRQQERERLNASKKIQRIWRGHKVRTELAESRRQTWDELATQEAASSATLKLIQQLQLLVAFFSPRRPDDLGRLSSLSSGVSLLGYQAFLPRPEIQPYLGRLAKVTLEGLQASGAEYGTILLNLLVSILDHRPDVIPKISRAYYTYLSQYISTGDVPKSNMTLVSTAMKISLREHIELEDNDQILRNAYSAFSLYLLTTPRLANSLGSLEGLAAIVDVGLLSSALVKEFSTGSIDHIQDERKLWLLAHFISIHRLQRRSSQETEYLRALSLQLSQSSAEIIGRMNAQDPEVLEDTVDDAELDRNPTLPLPTFVKHELLSLVKEESITGLIAKFNIDYVKESTAGEEDASLLASYALTLLRIFPHRGDDIRLWLYLGSMKTTNGIEVPALKFFWQAMSLTNTFSVIRADSKGALTLLRPQVQRNHPLSGDVGRDREWRTILLFLELYTFVLRFTDDEEFLGGNVPTFGQTKEPVSRIRQSALPIEDVKRLTIFLKNLAFTMYYNAGELSDDGHPVAGGSIGTYFGASVTTSRFQSAEAGIETQSLAKIPFARVAGMTFDYVRTLVASVMRMLYERDSRRKFLSKDHWLMTSRFEMEGFIPAVVMEEERQHQVREEGEDGDADNDDSQYADDREYTGLVGMSRPRRAQQLETLRRQQQKTVRQRILAAVGPRLEVLQNMPFVIPFETRVQIFRQFVLLDQTRRRGGNVDPDIWRMSVIHQSQMDPRNARTAGHELLGRHHAKIRRAQIFEDAYDQFYELGEGLKEPIQITFVDQFDTVEAGIDGGGVTKEFLTSITNRAFLSDDTSPSYFIANDQNLLYPNPASFDERRELLKAAGMKETSIEWKESMADLSKRYEFLGRVIGKCLYEGILVDIGFAGFFLLKWATSGTESGYRTNINDLRDLDEGLYQGLLKLKNYPGDVEDFSLDFTITDKISIPGENDRTISRDLQPNGSNITVTNKNKPLYINYVARHRLSVQPFRQTQAFLKGLSEIIKPSWLSMFNQSELQTLIGGDSSEVNVEDLRRNTQYGGVYQIGDDGQEHDTIKLFWKVLKELDDSDRRKVLKYVTSTPRAPLLGFSQLNPRFSIRDAGGDEERLPSTSTCVNLLKLPRYSTETTLRQKLLYAVNSGAGFDLS
ncbi:related to HUL5-ubiquitin-protein ligase (E3) [Rhynchosporium secalis]|uniref:HECT-type E3 ubiquitin transferase n=1 Tax=Rhynchosporium secalis TaxID=38038 RepID=A0A1E1LVX5_RHYSE|nr:related to HUL5-ubiquitin-protein ligase (E3) [Rhynchosporium secalis]